MSRKRPFVLTVAALCAAVVAGIGASVPAAAVSQTYIVVLDNSVADPAAAARAAGVMPTHVYRHALKGYAAPMSPAAAASIAVRGRTSAPSARRDRDDRRHPEPRDVGLRPHRPAEPPAEQLVRVHADGRRRDGLHPRHGDAPHAQRVHRSHHERRRPDRRRPGRGLPRPRHARRRHRRRHDVGRRKERQRSSPSACSTAQGPAPGPRSSPASTG